MCDAQHEKKKVEKIFISWAKGIFCTAYKIGISYKKV